MSSYTPDDRIIPAPAPWRLKGTIYSFVTYTSSKGPADLASATSFMYSPLEARSSFASGRFLGGIGMVQVIRYTDSPVGPYDELVIIPGAFGYRTVDTGGSGRDIKEEKHMRVTRIYVSQKHTCWNGRKNWNIPKHLARFAFETLPGNGLSIAVYPLQDDEPLSGLKSSTTPVFTARYQPISYLPCFPMSTSLAKYIGQDLSLAQPPLPQGRDNAEELVGTDKWCRVLPNEFSSRTSLGWWDLKQDNASEEGGLLTTVENGEDREGYENFWPGIGRWTIGTKMEDAIVSGSCGMGRAWRVRFL